MKEARFLSRLLTILGGFIVIGGGLLVARGGDAPDAAKRRAAARHYYLTATHYSATGRNAEAGELYKKAYQLDSTYAEAALQYGVRRWGMPADTLSTPTEKAESKRIAKKFNRQYPGDFFPNVFLSNVLERGYEFDESIEVLEKLHEVDPGNADVLQHLSALYLDTHDFDKALSTINEYQRIEGDDIEVLIRKTGMLMAMGDTTAALDETERLINKYPADSEYVIFKGQLYDYIGKPDSAIVAFKRAESMEKPGYGGGVKLQMADYYREHGDSVAYDSKIYEALLSEDLDFEAKNTVMGYYLTTMFQDSVDHSRGDRLFDVLREQYPHEPEMLSLSARYNAAKHEFGKALEDMDYALDLDHTNPNYWEQAMIYGVMLDDYSRVDSIFKRAQASLDKTPMRLYSLAGSNAVMQDDARRAIALYQQALDENFPGQELGKPVDMIALGPFLNLQNISDVINIFQQAGDAYYKLGEREKAFINYDSALEIDPDNPLTLNNYAYFLIEGTGQLPPEDLEKADEMSARAIANGPDNPVYLDTRAWLLFRKGEYQEAREMEERALELISEDASGEEIYEYQSHLGDILFMLNEPQEALEQWKKALENKPDDELLKKKVRHRTFFYE
ncbi:MAG: tetratricopeptide repeat protein [Bacteroides sp.]|nr:tetratricopeptide repeat protein [Bacteroides sp.]